MARLPSDAAVRARAEELGLAQPDQPLDHAVRKQVSKELLAAAQAAEAAPKPPPGTTGPLPIASIDVQLPDVGVLHLTVTLTPPKET